MMAAFRFLLQLLFLGSAIIPAYLQTERCNLTETAVPGNFSVSVIPTTYEANTTYEVTVTDNRNKNVSEVLLQAVSSNVSVGEWMVETLENCSNIFIAVVNATNTAVNWTSPSSDSLSVEIRAYIIFSNNTSEISTTTLNKNVANTTTASPSANPNSVSAVQSSTLFLAVVQVVLLFVTSKVLS